MSEVLIAKDVEGGAQIWAAVERAAAAVDHEIGIFRKSSNEFLEIGDALFIGSRAMECRAGNVRTSVESVNADIDNFQGWVFLLELFCEIGSRNGLFWSPGVG